jgi:hypothetical protein
MNSFGSAKWARLDWQRPLRQGAPQEAIAGHALEEYPDAVVAIVSGPSPGSRSRLVNTPELKEQRNALVLYVFAL